MSGLGRISRSDPFHPINFWMASRKPNLVRLLPNAAEPSSEPSAETLPIPKPDKVAAGDDISRVRFVGRQTVDHERAATSARHRASARSTMAR